MEKLFGLFLAITIISSCSKKSGTASDSIAGTLPDTLAPGWSKIVSLPHENFTDIFFADNMTGYAVSNNGVYKSTNSGTDWTKINSAAGMVNIGAGNSDKACFLNGSPLIFVTHDGGSTFSNPGYPNPGGGNPDFFDCFFSSPNTCYFSSNEYIWKSFDGGVSIDTVQHFSSTSSISSLFFLNDQQGWVLRLDGLYQTTDGGDSWNIDTTLANGYGSISFLDSNNGYFSNYGIINKTVDGGATWIPAFQSAVQAYAAIDFINVDEGYFSLGNKIYKTSDAGSTWTQVVALGNQFIGKIHFTDASHGWACTSDGTVVRYVQ